VTRLQVIRTVSATAITSVAIACPALAGGEPKNGDPFTRPAVPGRVTPAAPAPPSTQQRNEPPFTRPAEIVVQGNSGLSVTAAAIGAVAGIGLSVTAAGVLAFLDHRSRHIPERRPRP
jgi:hypothetical protein